MNSDPPTTVAAGPAFRRLVYWLAASVGVSFGAILYGTSVLITSQAAGAEFSISHLSWAYSGSVITGAAVAVPVGRLTDRHGARPLVACGGVLVMLGFAAFAASISEWQVLAAWWLLIGPGSAMVLFEPAFVALQQWFDASLRNRAAGVLTVITGLAGPIFIPATTFAVEHMGWRVTASLLGGTVLIVSMLASTWALRAAPKPAVGRDHGGRVEGSRSGRRVPAGFIALTIGLAIALGVFEAFNVHRIARFEVAGFDPALLAPWAAAVGLLSLPGRFVFPQLANRFPPERLMAVVILLGTPAIFLAIRGTTTWEMQGHFIIFGLFWAAMVPLRAVLMSDWYAGAGFGVLMGIQAVAVSFGRAGAPAVLGWLADTPLGYPAGMVLMAILMGLSLVMLAVAVRQRRSAVDRIASPSVPS